jgi:outer membrane protein OmpA-like peptidoglycan-associated protein
MPRLAIALVSLALPSVAAAQAIDDFRPAIDSRGYLTLNGSQTLDHGELSFGLGSLQWGHKLLTLQSDAASYSVDNMISATLVGALGLRPGGVPLEVGVALPFTIMNGSHGPEALGDPSTTSDDKLNRLAGQGLGDLGVHVKARIARLGRVGVGAIASLYVPTGGSRDPFLGESDPEVYNGIEDTDGCPDVDRPLVIESESELVTLQPIEFEFDKDVLRTTAYPILDAVVKSLRDNPDLVRIEVQGHTDEQGNDAYNLDLSNRRAATVLRYLVDAGIAAERLTSKGYGETKPVDTRHTQEAYTINRRVAFVIMERR